MDQEDYAWISKSISEMGDQLKDLMNSKFGHIEDLLNGIAGVNDREHARIEARIKAAEEKAERIAEEADAKIERTAVRVTHLEQRQSRDEGGARAKEMSQGMMITIILGGLGLLLGMFELIQLFIN